MAITYAQALENAIAVVESDNDMENRVETAEKLKALKAQIEKKHSSGSSKPTKTQKENEVIKGAILAVLTDEGQTASEILAQMPEGLSEKALTNQRVSALLRQLIADNKVVKSIEKKTSYFSLA